MDGDPGKEVHDQVGIIEFDEGFRNSITRGGRGTAVKEDSGDSGHYEKKDCRDFVTSDHLGLPGEGRVKVGYIGESTETKT